MRAADIIMKMESADKFRENPWCIQPSWINYMTSV